MTETKHYDAVIIGGGHNGLAAATVLAKKGRSVLVLEELLPQPAVMRTASIIPVSLDCISPSASRVSPMHGVGQCGSEKDEMATSKRVSEIGFCSLVPW